MRFFTLAFVVAFILTGCTGGDGCEYWVTQLKKGKRTKEAIAKIGEFKCPSGTPVLREKFPESLYRREVLTTLSELNLNNKDTTAIVTSALPDKEIGPLAIRLAMRWKIDKLPEKLAKLVRSQRSAQTRLQSLQALIELSLGITSEGDLPDNLCENPEKKQLPADALETVAWVLEQNPELQGIDTTRYAADLLGSPLCVDWSKQDKDSTKKTSQGLIKALIGEDSKGGSAQINARMALRAIGSPAMGPILAAFKGVNADLNDFAEVQAIPKWKYTQGPHLVEMLWDVGDSKASPDLMEALGLRLDPPPADVARLPEDQRIQWKQTNQNRLANTALTVGALVNDDAVKFAKALLARRNPAPDPHQFVQAGLALALMGTTKSCDALWELFMAGDKQIAANKIKIAALKAKVDRGGNKDKIRAMKIEHDGLIDDNTVTRDRKANFVTNLSVGLTNKYAKQFKSDVLGAEKGALKESAQQPLPKAYHAIVDRCGDKTDCYLKYLKKYVGKLDSIPKGIQAASKKLSDETKAAKKVAKPWNDKIKAKSKEIDVKYKAILVSKKEVESHPDKKSKACKKLRDGFNASLDVLDTMQAERDKLFEKRNEVYKVLAPHKKAMSDSQIPLYELEKAVLALGNLKGGDAAMPTIIELFGDGRPPFFVQLRQWGLITFEHIAKKKDVEALATLLKDLRSKMKGRSSDDFWTLRIESLVQRLKRL